MHALHIVLGIIFAVPGFYILEVSPKLTKPGYLIAELRRLLGTLLTFVTTSAKTILNGTFSITRNTDFKY